MRTFKVLKIAIFILGFYGLSSCNNADKKTANGNNQMNMAHGMQMNDNMMQHMQSMMKNTNMTGSFDCDFATIMINHHQGAIMMSEEELKNGNDPEMKQLAKNIISNQTDEITKMHSLLNNFKTVVAKDTTNADNKLQNQMTQMMDEMKKVKLTGNTDKDFAMMMIPHHESAIKMAQDQIKFGKQEELSQMAQQMIIDQNKEIDLFKEWLAKQK